MSQKLVVALFSLVLSATAAAAAVQSSPSNRLAGIDLARSAEVLSPQALGRKLAESRGSARYSTSIKLPAKALPSLGGYRTQRDAQQGATTFLWAEPGRAGATLAPLKAELMAKSAALEYLGRQASQLNLGKRDLENAELLDLQDNGKGPIIARYQQRLQGVPVFGKQVNVLMDRGMKLVATSGNFAAVDASNAGKLSAKGFRLQPEQAISAVSRRPRSAWRARAARATTAFTARAPPTARFVPPASCAPANSGTRWKASWCRPITPRCRPAASIWRMSTPTAI